VEFIVDPNFGVPGAITVANCYDNELFLESINIVQNISFTCKSWVQPNRLYPDKRIFFVNKVSSSNTMLCENAYSYILLYTNYFWCTPCIYYISPGVSTLWNTKWAERTERKGAKAIEG